MEQYKVETDHHSNCGLDNCDYRDKDHTISGLAPASGLPYFGCATLKPLLRRLVTLSCPIKTLNPSWLDFDAILSALGQLVKSVMSLYLHKEVPEIVLPLNQWKEELLPSQRMLAS